MTWILSFVKLDKKSSKNNFAKDKPYLSFLLLDICKNIFTFTETHGNMRLRTLVLWEQVWYESAETTSRPAQARGMRQKASRVSLL
jgi:hypothetical protein